MVCLNLKKIITLTSFLLFITVNISFAASSYASKAKLSLKMSNQSVINVLDAIESKTDFNLYYSDKLVDTNRKISINIEEEDIFTVLDEVFSNTNVSYKVIDKDIILTTTENIKKASQQQPVTIRGSISDEDGYFLPGVVVTISGSTTGDVTKANGEFSFTAPKGSIIEASFMGFKTTKFTVLGNKEVYNIIMETDAISADEVVVTALGIKRNEKALGYAMTSISGDEIASVNTISPLTALQGKAAGVSIKQSGGGLMGSSSIQIRGISTLNGSNRPIFVVDGVILANPEDGTTAGYGNILKNLNADDFESMNVLKGAAATALYGSRGINGAIVITTKSGKAGKGFGVSFSQVTGIDVAYKAPGNMQTEYTRGRYTGGIKGVNQPDGTLNKWDQTYNYMEKINGEYMPTLRIPGNSYSWGPRYSDLQALGFDKIVDFDGEVVDYKLYEDNLLDAYQTGVNTSTNVSISGGTEKTTFYLSNTYQYRKGSFVGNTFEKNSTLLKGSYKISNKINIEASIAYNTSTGTNPLNDRTHSIGHNFTFGDFDRTFNWNKYKDGWMTPHGGMPNVAYGEAMGAVRGMDFIWEMNTMNNSRSENLITPIIRLNYEIADWISFNAEANMNIYNIETDRRKRGSGYGMVGADGSYSLGFEKQAQRSAKAAFNLGKRFGDFGANLIVGGEWFRSRNSWLNSHTNGGLTSPGLFFLGNSINPLTTNGGLGNYKNIYSVFFLASFDYKNKLFLDITGRNDWSTSMVYTNGDGNNSYFYPSVSGSWIFSESFDMPEWITFGKLRTSWAQVGNDTSPYSINSVYGIGSYQYGSGTAYVNSFDQTSRNPSLEPELKTSIEFGIDLRMFNNRIGLDLTYYKENTKNQIISLPMPSESGLVSQLTNAGNIQNQGWELAINTTPIRKKNFTWDLNFIYTRNRNKIIELHPDMGAYHKLGGDLGGGGVMVVAKEGAAYGDVITTSMPATNENGDKLLNWHQGKRGAFYYRSQEEQKIGDINPDFEGSIFSNFKFYGVTIGIAIDSRLGGLVASNSSRYGTNMGTSGESMKYRNAENGGVSWTSKWNDEKGGLSYEDGIILDGVFKDDQIITVPSGGEQNVGGMTYREAYEKGYVEPTHSSTFFADHNSWSVGVIDDNWVRKEMKYVALRNVSVGYTFPNKITNKLKLSNLHISLDAQNLCYLYNNMPSNVHPESIIGSNPWDVTESEFIPYVATYSLAIRFNL